MANAAVLLLEDGTVFHGRAVGHEGRAVGKLVSYAGVTGFPDLMTDPSYHGKITCFTYPHVGNPGVGPADFQSDAPHAAAVVMREICPIKANRLGEETFDQFLKRYRVPGIDSVDTRRLARLLYEKGPLLGAVGGGKHADEKALRKLLDEYDASAPAARDFAVSRAQKWNDPAKTDDENRRFRVIVHDFGVKRGFLRRLGAMGCEVKLVPHDHQAKDSLAEDVDGVIFSAGPGDPSAEIKAIKAAEAIIGQKPLWGIGVGAGVIALAAGAKITIDGRGHYGAQGVGRRDEPSGEMTMQCHDFWIAPESLGPAGLEMSHFHLNDKSIEGFESEDKALMGVLFHPESEPGSRDSLYLFDRFGEMMQARQSIWQGLL